MFYNVDWFNVTIQKPEGKLGAHTCNSNTQEAETGLKFDASLAYIAKTSYTNTFKSTSCKHAFKLLPSVYDVGTRADMQVGGQRTTLGSVFPTFTLDFELRSSGLHS